jgi:hypothetical protein
MEGSSITRIAACGIAMVLCTAVQTDAGTAAIDAGTKYQRLYAAGSARPRRGVLP